MQNHRSCTLTCGIRSQCPAWELPEVNPTRGHLSSSDQSAASPDGFKGANPQAANSSGAATGVFPRLAGKNACKPTSTELPQLGTSRPKQLRQEVERKRMGDYQLQCSLTLSSGRWSVAPESTFDLGKRYVLLTRQPILSSLEFGHERWQLEEPFGGWCPRSNDTAC